MQFLRFLTINVWSGLDYQGLFRMGEYETAPERRARYGALVSGLKALAPDVIAVNEANPLPSYMRHLAADLGYDEIHFPGLAGVRLGPLGLPVNLREGDGLLARRELGLRFVGRRRLSGGPVGRQASLNFANATQVIAGRIRAGGGEIDLFCTHWTVAGGAAAYAHELGCRAGTAEGLPSAERRLAREAHEAAAKERLGEAATTVAWMREVSPPGRPAILMGDLNAPPGSVEIALLAESGWVDGFGHLHPSGEGATWDQGQNGLILRHYQGARLAPGIRERLDYIFVNDVLGGASIRGARVVLDGRDGRPTVSDHYGLLCEIVVTPG
jgi:hypothetical protein